MPPKSKKPAKRTKKPVNGKTVTTPIAMLTPSSVLPLPAHKRFTQWVCSPGNVCVPYVEPAFTENANWRIFRIMAEFIDGFDFLSKLKNEVSIFGSTRSSPNSEYYKEARKLGKLLGKGGYTVVTGGGPGIMEAANRGAAEAGGVSAGLNIELAANQRTNGYVTNAIGFHHFFVRKVMLSASSQAYVFFPGGFGTLDEMTEMLTLIQTQKIPRNVPLILFGKTFWQPLLDWCKNVLVAERKYVDQDEFDIIQVVDTPEEAMKIIQKTMERPFN